MTPRRRLLGTPRAVLGLGANLGDRLTNLRRATDLVDAVPGLVVVARSRVYESAPVGPPQPDYLNAAVLVSCDLEPAELLARALEIERALGRVRPDPIRWGPRLIDVDILWLSRGAVDTSGLTVPHPRLVERPFALCPLLDVVPDAICPRTSQPYASLPIHPPPIVCEQL